MPERGFRSTKVPRETYTFTLGTLYEKGAAANEDEIDGEKEVRYKKPQGRAGGTMTQTRFQFLLHIRKGRNQVISRLTPRARYVLGVPGPTAARFVQHGVLTPDLEPSTLCIYHHEIRYSGYI